MIEMRSREWLTFAAAAATGVTAGSCLSLTRPGPRLADYQAGGLSPAAAAALIIGVVLIVWAWRRAPLLMAGLAVWHDAQPRVVTVVLIICLTATCGAVLGWLGLAMSLCTLVYVAGKVGAIRASTGRWVRVLFLPLVSVMIDWPVTRPRYAGPIAVAATGTAAAIAVAAGAGHPMLVSIALVAAISGLAHNALLIRDDASHAPAGSWVNALGVATAALIATWIGLGGAPRTLVQDTPIVQGFRALLALAGIAP